MKVLLTGGAGYIGTELTKYLLRNPKVSDIVIYDNMSTSHSNFFLGVKYFAGDKLTFIEGDILDSRLLKKAMKDADVVVHLAAKVTTPFANTDPHFFEQVNHWGTAEVVYAAEESDISKFIYISSTSVYGAHTEPCTEETTPTPGTFYGISKYRGEEHVQRLAELKNSITLRCGNVYGYSKSMRFDAVINKFMFDANFKRRIQIFGNGKQSRAFIHIFHLAEMIEQVITENVPSGTYNIVDKNLQILDVVDIVKEIFPDLEFLFTNQHMELRELVIDQSSKIYDHIKKFETTELKKELIDFQNGFAF